MNKDGAGHIFHVVGSIQVGVVYGNRPSRAPEKSLFFAKKSYVSNISGADFGRFHSVLEKIPAPAKQLIGPKRINPAEPLCTCQEWAQEGLRL